MVAEKILLRFLLMVSSPFERGALGEADREKQGTGRFSLGKERFFIIGIHLITNTEKRKRYTPFSLTCFEQ